MGLFIIKEREDEKGWAQAPSVVGTDSNYYNRTYWKSYKMVTSSSLKTSCLSNTCFKMAVKFKANQEMKISQKHLPLLEPMQITITELEATKGVAKTEN